MYRHLCEIKKETNTIKNKNITKVIKHANLPGVSFEAHFLPNDTTPIKYQRFLAGSYIVNGPPVCANLIHFIRMIN